MYSPGTASQAREPDSPSGISAVVPRFRYLILWQTNADDLITTRLRDALSLVDIRVLDHVLGEFCSVTTAVKLLQIAGVSRYQSRTKDSIDGW